MIVSSVLDPKQLNDTQKRWFALAICGAIIADGHISSSEILYLEKALSFLHSPSQVDTLIQSVKTHQLPPLSTMEEASRELQVQMLAELVLVIAADSTMTTREMSYLFEVGSKLGFPKEFVRILIKWGNEGILWKQKLQSLMEAGVNLEAFYEK